MPALNSSVALYKKYLIVSQKCLTVLLECVTVLLESIDLCDTVDDITKNFKAAPPPLFRGTLALPTSYVLLMPACLPDSDITNKSYKVMDKWIYIE